MDDIDEGMAGSDYGASLEESYGGLSSGDDSFDMYGGLDLSGLDDGFGPDAGASLDAPGAGCGFNEDFDTASFDDSHENAVGLSGCSGFGFEAQIEDGLQELDADGRIEHGEFSMQEADLGGELEIGAEIEAFEEVIDGINPNYDPFSDGPYNTNCGSCALALEARLSGADSTAVASPVIVGTVEEMNRITGMEQVPMSPEGIQSYAEAKGAGYHAIVGFDVPGGDGHWFNVAVSESGRAYALDSQCGVVMPFGEYVEAYASDGVNFDISIKRG